MAATNTFEKRLRLVWESVGSEKVRKDVQGVLTTTGKLDNRKTKKIDNLANNLGVTPEAIEQFGEFTKETEVQKEAFSRTRKEAQRFKGEYLGIMFAGMSLQRVFGGLTKDLLSNYQEMIGEGVTPLSEGLTRLEASFKFLKFSIVEAAGPLILRFTDMLSEMAVSIARMNPRTLTTIFGSIAALAGIGGIMNVFGQGAIFFSSIASATASKEVIKALTATGNLDADALNAGTTFLNKAASFGGVVALSIGIGKTLYDLSGNEISFGDILADSLLVGVGAGLTLYGMAGFSAAAAGIAGAVAAGVIVLSMTLEKGSRDKAEKEIREAFLSFRSRQIDISDIFEYPEMTESIVRPAILQQSQIEADRTWWNPFDSPSSVARELTEDYKKVIDEFNKGLITEPEAAAQIKQLLPVLPSEDEMNQFNSQLASVQTQSNSIGASWNSTNTTISETIPENTKAWMDDEEKGLKGVESKVNNINTELGKTINKTVKIKYEYSGVRNPDSNSSSVNPNT